jgi:hypothetical protein
MSGIDTRLNKLEAAAGVGKGHIFINFSNAPDIYQGHFDGKELLLSRAEFDAFRKEHENVEVIIVEFVSPGKI